MFIAYNFFVPDIFWNWAFRCWSHFLTQAGLVLCQGHIPDKHHANQSHTNRTQSSHWKYYIFPGG